MHRYITAWIDTNTVCIDALHLASTHMSSGALTYVSSIFASIHKHLHRYIASMHRLIYDMHRLMSYLAPWKQLNQDMHRYIMPCIDSFVFEVDSFEFEVDSYTSNRLRFVCITVCIDHKLFVSTHK